MVRKSAVIIGVCGVRRVAVLQLDALPGERDADAQRFVLGGAKHRAAGEPPRLPHLARRVGEGLLDELLQHVGEPARLFAAGEHHGNAPSTEPLDA